MSEQQQQNQFKNSTNADTKPEIEQPNDPWITEPLPESSRPRRDGPGGEGK